MTVDPRVLNLVAGGLVLALAYQYSQYRTAADRETAAEHRRRVTQLLAAILATVYASSVLFPMADGWPVTVGRLFQAALADATQVGQTLGRPQSGAVPTLRRALGVLGLVVYTLVWLGASLSVQIPVKLYRLVFG